MSELSYILDSNCSDNLFSSDDSDNLYDSDNSDGSFSEFETNELLLTKEKIILQELDKFLIVDKERSCILTSICYNISIKKILLNKVCLHLKSH